MKQALRHPYKRFFGTLANQQRIDVIEVLRKGKKNVSEMCRILKCNQTTLSHNLSHLELCGFVSCSQKGRTRTYALNNTTIRPLLRLMHKHMSAHCARLQ